MSKGENVLNICGDCGRLAILVDGVVCDPCDRFHAACDMEYSTFRSSRLREDSDSVNPWL